MVMEPPQVPQEQEPAFEPTEAGPVAHIPENHERFLKTSNQEFKVPDKSEKVDEAPDDHYGPTEATDQPDGHLYLQRATTHQEFKYPEKSEKDYESSAHFSPTEAGPVNERYLQRVTSSHQDFKVPQKSEKSYKTPSSPRFGSTEAGPNSGRFLQSVTASQQDFKVPEKSEKDYEYPAGAHFSPTEAGHQLDNQRRFLQRVATNRQEYKIPEKPEKDYGTPERVYSQPEENYEVDEAVSVMTNGRAHGVQPQSTSSPARLSVQDAEKKSGYVVEGRNYRKYRVEERTPDGFIVGEYGVVSHDDGSLRGVRYTADGTINPRLIYDALLKFLNL